FSPWRRRTRWTPFAEMTIPPHLSRRSTAEILIGPNPGVAQGEGQDPLLDERRGLVGHLGAAALSGPQDLRAEPEHLVTPPIEGGWMDPHGSAGRPYVAQLLGERQCSQPEPVQ